MRWIRSECEVAAHRMIAARDEPKPPERRGRPRRKIILRFIEVRRHERRITMHARTRCIASPINTGARNANTETEDFRRLMTDVANRHQQAMQGMSGGRLRNYMKRTDRRRDHRRLAYPDPGHPTVSACTSSRAAANCKSSSHQTGRINS